MSEALAEHADDLIVFSVDPDIMRTVAQGFYGFSASKIMIKNFFIHISVEANDAEVEEIRDKKIM